MKIRCIDIGNTSTHFGVLGNGKVLFSERVSTKNDSFAEVIEKAFKFSFDAVSYASVAPDVNEKLEQPLLNIGKKPFQLTHNHCVGLKVNYPRPE